MRLRPSGRVGRPAEVVVAGGGGDFDPVGAAVVESGDQGDLPAGHLADEVAAGADAAAVGEGGGAAVGVAVDVVEVPDRRIAVRVAAVLVAEGDELAEPALEAAAVRVAADQLAGRAGEQPPPPP